MPVLGQELQNQLVPACRQVDEGSGRLGLRMEDPPRNSERCVRGEGMPAGHQLVQDHAESEKVRRRIGRSTLELLRSHVGKRPGDLQPHRFLDAGIHRRSMQGQTKVQDFHEVICADHDVLRLEITVDDSHLVGAEEGRGNLLAEHRNPLRRRGNPGQHLSERPTIDPLHDDESLITVLVDIVDCHDRGVVEGGGGARLGERVLELVGRLALRPTNDLECHGPVEHRIGGSVDVAESTRTDLLLYVVATYSRLRRKIHHFAPSDGNRRPQSVPGITTSPD